MKDRDCFDKWKRRVHEMMPEVAIRIYTAKSNKHIEYEKEVLLGRVIANISNPFYAIIDEQTGKRLDEMGRMSAEVVLKIQVHELFAYYRSLPRVEG